MRDDKLTPEQRRLKMRGLADNLFQQITIIQASREWIAQILDRHGKDPDFMTRVDELALHHLIEQNYETAHPTATHAASIHAQPSDT